MSTHTSRSKKSKSKRRKSYQEHYELSMNNLIEAFETNLDISPILPNKSTSKMSYQSEEKQTEIPDFSLTLSSETDDIPRIKEIQQDEIYENNTDTDYNNSPPTENNIELINTNNIHSQKQQLVYIEHKSDCNDTKQSIENHINNIDNIYEESLQFAPQLSHQSMIPNTPQLPLSQTMQFVHPQQAINPQLIHQQFSQSYDFGMHNNNYQQQQQQPIHPQFSQSNGFSLHNINTQQQLIQKDNINNVNNIGNLNNISNISHFPPQKLIFPSNSSSLMNTNNLNNNNNNSINDELSNEKDEDEYGQEEEEEDDNLFMPITPTLSGSALRALLSQLRRKCKTLKFKCKQQRKYIINIQNEINYAKNEISNQKIKIYDNEQSILMLQNKNDISNLEYLRGAELHQTRQELTFIINKMNELQSDNLNLKQQMQLQELDHTTYNKSLKDEYQRLLREINQHKVLFDQRGREIKELKENNNNQNEDYTEKLKQTNESKEEINNKLITVTQQLSTLRNNYQDIKNNYDIVYQEKEKLQKLNKDFALELDEKEQNIISLSRVKNNLEQEIDALCRSNRNFREIRNKSTSQLLESQKYEIDSIKQQISQQYENYLEQEKIKNDKLKELLKEKNMEIKNMNNNCNNDNNNNNNNYNETLEILEIENNELRKKLEEYASGDTNTDIIDPYNCNPSTASSSMDEFGMLMLKSAKEEIEQLRQTNEKLMKLYAKNHFKKPRIQDQCTQTYDDNMDNINDQTQTTNSPNSSFGSIHTQKSFGNFNQSPIRNRDNHQFEELSSSPTKSDKVLINDMSIVTTVDNSFTKS